MCLVEAASFPNKIVKIEGQQPCDSVSAACSQLPDGAGPLSPLRTDDRTLKGTQTRFGADRLALFPA